MNYDGHPDQKLGHITYSQWGQDLMILNLCWQLGLSLPTYLDLGAHHPFNISNTALLYSKGSRGVNVEPNPYLIGDLRRHRPEDRNVEAAVGIVEGLGEYHMIGFTSGLNSLSKQSIRDHGHEPNMSINVNMMTINQIVATYCNGKFPDILFTDVEGVDLEVLKSADFDLYDKPHIICSEIRKSMSTGARAIMYAKNFISLCRMGEDLIFVRRELYHLCS